MLLKTVVIFHGREVEDESVCDGVRAADAVSGRGGKYSRAL